MRTSDVRLHIGESRGCGFARFTGAPEWRRNLEVNDDYTRVGASIARRARRRLRVRPCRLRDRADGARNLALRGAAFDRGAADPDLFRPRADFDAAVVLAVDRVQAGLAI